MADILIRGMDNIPVGQEFVIVENVDFERYLYNRKTGETFHLIPLPEGRGRLGDLDKLEDAFIRHYLEQERKNNLVFAAAEIKQRIVDMIEDCPTIVPAEGGGEK